MDGGFRPPCPGAAPASNTCSRAFPQRRPADDLPRRRRLLGGGLDLPPASPSPTGPSSPSRPSWSPSRYICCSADKPADDHAPARAWAAPRPVRPRHPLTPGNTHTASHAGFCWHTTCYFFRKSCGHAAIAKCCTARKVLQVRASLTRPGDSGRPTAVRPLINDDHSCTGSFARAGRPACWGRQEINRRRNHAQTQTGHGRQRDGGRPHAGRAAEDRAGDVRHHGVWRRAHPNYNRILLSRCWPADDDRTSSSTICAWYADNGITLHLGSTVTGIDRNTRSVTATGKDGETISVDYDRLLIATGSTPSSCRSPATTCPA